MKRAGILLGLVFLGSAALPAWADTADALRDAAAAALQKVDQFALKESARVKESARQTRHLGVEFNSVAAQSAPLLDQLKNRKGELEERIDALEQQIKTLKEQAGKLRLIQEKITALVPKFAGFTGEDQGIQASQHILAAVAQDRTKATRLVDAIQRRNADDVSGLLRSAFEGARVQIGSMPEGEGATVNFRVGDLVHCLSTEKRCRGGTSSLGRSETRDAAEPRLKELQSLLAVAGRETVLGNKAVEDLLSGLGSAPRGSVPISTTRAAELQRLLERLSAVQATSSQLSRDIAAAMDRVIARS